MSVAGPGRGAEYPIWLYEKARPSPGLSNNLQKKSRCTLPPHIWKQYIYDKHNQMVKSRHSLILLSADQLNKQFMKSHRVCLPVTKETVVGSKRFDYCNIFIWGIFWATHSISDVTAALLPVFKQTKGVTVQVNDILNTLVSKCGGIIHLKHTLLIVRFKIFILGYH